MAPYMVMTRAFFKTGTTPKKSAPTKKRAYSPWGFFDLCFATLAKMVQQPGDSAEAPRPSFPIFS